MRRSTIVAALKLLPVLLLLTLADIVKADTRVVRSTPDSVTLYSDMLTPVSLHRVAVGRGASIVSVTLGNTVPMAVAPTAVTVQTSDGVVIIFGVNTNTGHSKAGSATQWFSVFSMHQYGIEVATGFDVRALQRELERLGIKTRPRPPVAKPQRPLSS